MALNPESARFNDLIVGARAAGPAPTPVRLRQGWAELIAQVGPATTTCEVEPVDLGGVPALCFTPPACDGGLLIWFHLGGFVFASAALARGEVDRLCVAARCRGVSVDYRLAPEHPFPASQVDALAATRWCLEHADALGIDSARIAVGGDSSGGTLAAVCAQRTRGLRAQVLVYPACDWTEEWMAGYENAEGYVLDAATMRYFRSCAAGGVDLSDPLFSPLLAPSEALRGMSDALLITAEYDPLRNDSRRYAERLRTAGVHVEEAHFEDEVHCFFNLPEVLDGARLAIAIAASFLAPRLAPA